MSEIENLQNITHQYRKSLEAFASRTEAQTHEIERRGSGSEREQIARMDADLSSIERSMQSDAALRKAQAENAELRAKLDEPQFRAAVPAKGGIDLASPEYAARWLKAVARGDAAELRVLTTATTDAGIPTDMERRIVQKMFQSSVLRQLGKVSTIDSKRTIVVEGSLPTSNLVVESNAITASDPSFASVSVVPYKFVCATTMSQEFIDDAIGAGGIGSGMQYVADRCGVSLAKIMDQYYTVGTGSSQPQGIGDTGSTDWATTNGGRIINQGVQLAEDKGAVDITGDNLIDCVHAVPPQYRVGNFKILTSDTAIKTIRKIKVNSTDYVWKLNEVGGLSGGNPGTILGVPYFIGEYVAATQTAATSSAVRGSAFLIAGNWDYFEIFDRTGMTSMIDPYSAAANQRVTMYLTVRTDSKIMQTEAFAAIYGLNAVA